jgi:pimeloyl-ACP methyl ester carboxylesterase
VSQIVMEVCRKLTRQQPRRRESVEEGPAISLYCQSQPVINLRFALQSTLMPSDQKGFIQAEPDVRLFFRSVGKGDAVLIPLVSWTEEFDALANGRQIIFYNPRSRGQSSAVPLEHISFQNDIRDLEAVRDHFDLDKVSLIGWSYFGAVVARYAMDFSQHVDRFVMACGPPIRRSPHSEAINRVMAERINAVAPGFLQ